MTVLDEWRLRRDVHSILWAVGLVVGISSAFLFWWSRQSLWEDELIALTHTLQPFPGFFIEILRNDIHPFAYFLLLKIWTVVAPDNDHWILLSSHIWNIASLCVLGVIVHRLCGWQCAVWAVAVYALLPNFAWASGNLRMYGLVPFLALLVWWFQRSYLINGRYSRLGVAVAAQVTLAYVHAIGFFFLFFIALTVLAELSGSIDRRRLLRWFGSQAFVAIAILPLVVSALIRGTEPLPAASLATLALAPAQLFSGWALANQPAALVLSYLIFLVLGGLAARSQAGRRIFGVAVLAVLVAAMIVGAFGKPMFKPPVFTAHLVPFAVLAAAIGLRSEGRSFTLARRIASSLVLTLAIVTVPWSTALRPAENFSGAARFVASHAQPGDVVLIPRLSVFWGIARYAIGPDWGKPLEVMPADNPTWQALKQRLGPVWVEFLGLMPHRRSLESNGVRYIVGLDVDLPVHPDATIWVVHRHRYTDTVRLPWPAVNQGVKWFGDELSVARLVESRVDNTAAMIQFSNPPLAASVR